MDQQLKLLRISTLLSRFSAQTSILNANGEYSINIHAENLLIKILNELYGLELKNINYTEGKMTPGIDLGDTTRRIAVQVTSTPDTSKILRTIHQFNEKKLYEKYDQLYIYIITQKLSSYNHHKINDAVNGKFIFTAAHIIDHRDIYKALNERNDLETINRILYCLEQQFSDNSNVSDPYAGLPDLNVTTLPASPYISLRSYQEEEAAIFWGRGHQIKELYDAVWDAHCNPVILLYGQTGVGKSSLLEAGLIPRLKMQADVRYRSRLVEHGLSQTLYMALGYSAGDLEEHQWSDRKMVLIIDQLEEAWTQPIKELPDEIDRFFTDLKNLLASVQNNAVKVLLGYRKEYHAEVEQLCMRYGIPVMSFFLQPVGRNGIKEVVNGCLLSKAAKRQYQLEIEADLDEQIANDLSADTESPVMPVLQILMTNLWQGVSSSIPGKRILTHSAYQQLRKTGYALSNFLDAKLDDIRQSYREEVESGIVLDLLFFFTTTLATAASHSREAAIERYEQDIPVRELIRICVDHYLLTESREDKNSFSLAHDTLAPIVRSRFESSLLPGPKASRILQNHHADLVNGGLHSLSVNDFTTVINGRKGMRRWTEEEIGFIERSGQQPLEFQTQEILLRQAVMDIHDDIGSMLSVLKLNLSAFDYTPPEQHPDIIHESKELVGTIIQGVRNIYKSLDLSMLEIFQLTPVLESHVMQVAKFFSVAWAVSGNEPELTRNEKLALYRVVQEAVNNIIKHAEAQKISVDVKFTGSELSIVIEDDGNGFDPGEISGDGHGIRNMKYRMLVVKGNLEITSSPGKGCTIFIRLPLKNKPVKSSSPDSM